MIDPEFQHLKNTRSIKFYVANYLQTISGEIRGARVADLPAGVGATSMVLRDLGADVEPYDLFPESFSVDGLICRSIDLSKNFSLESDCYNVVVCQEGIEHVSDQNMLIGELSRILAPGGKLIVTTPNYSSLASKLAYLMFESEFSKRMPPNVHDDIWWEDGGRRYFGHVFLIGIQKLNTLASIHGLKLVSVEKNVVSRGSVVMAFMLYPLVFLFSLKTFIKRSILQRNSLSEELCFRQQWLLNISPSVLTQKYLFLVYEKTKSSSNMD